MVDEEAPAASYTSCQMGALIFVTGLSLFNFSYTASNIGGVLLYIDRAHTDCSKDAICLDSSLMKGILVSSCLVGAFSGALFAGTLAVRYGPRTILLANNFFFIVGSISSALAPGILCLILARCVVGIGVGIASALVHVYIGEVVPADRRGEHGATLVMMGTGGILVANLTCWLLSHHWRWVLALGCVPAMIQLVWGSMIMPESSSWSAPRANCGRLRALEMVCHQNSDERDLENPEDSEKSDDTCLLESGAGWSNLWQSILTGQAIPPLIIGCGLHVLAQASGINVIIYYGPKMFTLAGLPNSTAVFVSAGISFAQMCSTLLLSRMVDRVGRKPMSYIGLSFMLLSLCGIACSYWLPPSHLAGWLALVSCFCFRVAFSVSLGPLPYIITAEIFPESIRTPGVSFCLAVKWVANFAIALSWLPLSEVFTLAGTFVLYFAMCVLSIFFLAFYVPETSGKTLGQASQAVWKKLQDTSDMSP